MPKPLKTRVIQAFLEQMLLRGYCSVTNRFWNPSSRLTSRLCTSTNSSCYLTVRFQHPSAPLPTDLANLVAALQQFLASYKQASGTVPAASEQTNESEEHSHDSDRWVNADDSLQVFGMKWSCRKAVGVRIVLAEFGLVASLSLQHVCDLA